MDFGSLLQAAKHNQANAQRDVRTYNTKFSAPRKEEKKDKTLSANIQKFLARKEVEEKRKQTESNKKRDELLALRSKDKKATRRVNVMLKRTKSANQSVIDDAVDKDNTAVTLIGGSQPDEDDYGYVSQEASAFYNKMMEKYSKLPDDPKFPTARKAVSHNLSSTKDRVKAALEREREEALLPHRRKRKHKEEAEATHEVEVEQKSETKPKPKPQAPPPLNFSELLKIAEKKQFEPVVIEVKPKEDDAPPMTKKQRREFERVQQWRESKKAAEGRPSAQVTEEIRKLNEKPGRPVDKVKSNTSNGTAPKYTPSISQLAKQLDKNTKPVDRNVKPVDKSDKSSKQPKTEPPRKVIPSKGQCDNSYKTDSKYDPSDSKLNLSKPVAKTKPPPSPAGKATSMDARKQQLLEQHMRRKELEASVKPKQFPPADLAPFKRPVAPNEMRKKPIKNKRRILDSDEEYDSEMDDFIDDGPDGMEDYSKHIKEIFGYDKNKYRYDDRDVDNMESSFSQQMREDVRSTKMGIMEDLEDIKREREEKRRKAMLLKKRK